MLLSRRTIGPAYEMSPAEKGGRWLRDHLLRLVGAIAAAALFCWTTGWIVADLMNFLAAEKAYSDEGPARFSGSDPIVIGIQLLGSLLLGYFFLFRLKVHDKY